jgi:hypothetical protein
MVSCGLLPAAYRSVCMQQAKAMEMYVVDPDAAAACVQSSGVTCDDLAALESGDPNSPPAWLTTCLAYDTSTFLCSGDGTTLHVCNTSHACKDINCTSACTSIGYSYYGCGVAGGASYDRCECI